MKCSRCGNSIKTIFHCNICVQKFCSEDCLMSHSSLDHQSNISYSVTNQSLNNNTPLFINKQNYNLKSIISPYLVKGTYNNSELKYDQFFSLENFNLIFSNGEPELKRMESDGVVFSTGCGKKNIYYLYDYGDCSDSKQTTLFDRGWITV